MASETSSIGMEGRTETDMLLLVISQLFFTCFGSLFNLLLFIILKDLPDLSCSTYHVLLANVTASNLFVCTIVKSVGSIYITYAFAKVLNHTKKSPPSFTRVLTVLPSSSAHFMRFAIG
jgi:hypothetical protein